MDKGITHGLLQYCKGLRGEEQDSQEIDWPEGIRERERQQESKREEMSQPQTTKSTPSKPRATNQYSLEGQLSVTQIGTCFDKIHTSTHKHSHRNCT